VNAALSATAAILALALSGCASLVVGQSREADVRAAMGAPARERQLPDGDRQLYYPRQPLGHENYRVTLAPDGTVRSVEQLLTEENFARLRPGMTQAEVEQQLGRHAETMSFPNLQEDVLSWRFYDGVNTPMFFNAHFDPPGRLKYTTRTEELQPENLETE
jgi:hypothetical protein